jgi:hypothetical protein
MIFFIVLEVTTDPTSMPSNDINLAHNLHLRRVSMTIYTPPYHNRLMENAFTLLSQITSPQVDHVSLTIRSLSDLDGVDWAPMERVFAQQRWANLQRLLVRLSEVQTAAVEWIRTRLPILESRGVVVTTDTWDTSNVFSFQCTV